MGDPRAGTPAIHHPWRPEAPAPTACGGDIQKRALRLLLDARAARKGGPQALVRRRRDRLAVMVAHARTCPLCYRRRYQRFPARITDPQVLPSPTQAELMTNFKWVTDPVLILADVRASWPPARTPPGLGGCTCSTAGPWP